MNPVISITSADSVTVFVGGKPFTVASDHARYDELKDAISAADYDLVDKIVNTSNHLTQVLGVFGDVQVFQGHVTFQGRPVHNHLVDRLLQMVNRGRDPEPYARFLDRVMRNPTRAAADQLFAWLERAKLPILPDGRFLAYRRVRKDYLDVHSKSMDNTPGLTVSMPRAECDLDKDNTCSRGLHFCNYQYLSQFSGDRILIMAEDPTFVVSFPDDAGGSKGRTSQHEVLFEVDRTTALANQVFAGEDTLVFGWDRVEYFQRNQLNFIPSDEEDAPSLLAAWDAGYRVRVSEDQKSWIIKNPSGLLMTDQPFISRSAAWHFAAELVAV